MKVVISRKLMIDALTKGGAAALSDEAQADNCTLSMLIKSVRISIDKDLTVESGTNLIYVKHTVPINDETGIKVSEPGTVIVPAKEFMNFLSVQREDAIIGLQLHRFATPETINIGDGGFNENSSEDDKKEEKLDLKKIGQLKLSSKCSGDSSKTNGKWELECYEENRFSVVDFDINKDKQFEINGSRMINALGSVIFASLDKDYDHIWDSTSIQVYKDDLYFITTDGTRIAIYKMPKSDVKDITSIRPLLVPCKLLDQISKIIDKDEGLVFSYSETINRVFISQPNTNIRLACADKDKAVGFPTLEKLLSKKYKDLVELPKFALLELLNSASLVNKDSALFKFKKSDNTVAVKAISEDGKHKPTIKEASADSVSDDAMLIWAVKRLSEGMKVIKADRIKLALPENRKSVRVSEVGDENFWYYVMALENKKYDSDIQADAKAKI